METITNFIQDYLDYQLLSLIILSGIFITKYTKDIKINNTYKVLLASLVISLSLYLIEDCTAKCLNKYLFTYLFATSFYELIVKITIEKITLIIKK